MYIGNEPLTINGNRSDLTVSDFWRWAYSNLSSGENEVNFAEFLVFAALSSTGRLVVLADDSKRPYDFLTTDGMRVEVKSSAYIHAADPKQPDCISFRISPENGARRQLVDVYVFCIFKEMQADADRLDMDSWDFYVIPSRVLDEGNRGRSSITFSSMLKLKPIWCDFYGIGDAIEKAMTA